MQVDQDSDSGSQIGPPARQSSRSARSHRSKRSRITRRRICHSCQTCRRRKVKCDKVHPICGNCSKIAAACTYDDEPSQNDIRASPAKLRTPIPDALEENENRSKGTLFSPGQTPDLCAIETQLAKLTSLVEQLQEDRRALRRDTVNSEPVAASTANGDSGPEQPSGAAVDGSSDEFAIPTGLATDPVDPLSGSNVGHLSHARRGSSRYVGTTYWAYISHELGELNQLLTSQDQTRDFATAGDTMADPPRGAQGQILRSRIPSEFPGVAPHAFSLRSGTFPLVDDEVRADMLDNVPTKMQSDILYKGFMSGVHPLSPIIHPPSVLKLYTEFWNWYGMAPYTRGPWTEPSFVPLLYAIWFGGSVSISSGTIKTSFSCSRSELSECYADEVTCWLARIPFPRSASLYDLAAYLITQTILSREEEPLRSSLFISLAVRVSQSLGLHRDPSQFNIEPCEGEFRRRVWWHIVHMDSVIAMSSGLPPLLSEDTYWDVRETSEVKDTLISTIQAEQYEHLVSTGQRPPDNPDDPTLCGGPSMVNVYYLSARGKCIMAQSVHRILKIQLGTKPVTRGDMEELRSALHDLQEKLNSIVNRIPTSGNSANPSAPPESAESESRASARSCAAAIPGDDGPSGCHEQYHSPVLVAFHKWTRILLSLFIDKAFCVAYQPFLRNPQSRIWPYARQSALRHCYAFMEKFIQLAADPEFKPFRWGWPGNHQPMHATMILLIDLYKRPYSPEAPVSRSFIDRILALAGPGEGIVGTRDDLPTLRPLGDAGREAWNMIHRLRQKAWLKAGLNPNLPLHALSSQGQSPSDVPEAAGNLKRQRSSSDSARFSPAMPPTSVITSTARSPHSLHVPTSAADFDFVSSYPTSAADFDFVSSYPAMNSTNPTIPTPIPESCPSSTGDPAVSFDWGEWDAIFGRSLPVTDELMGLDPATGLAFANLENDDM